MKRMYCYSAIVLFVIGCPNLGYSANVEWNRAIIMYEGLDASGSYEQYTMGSPYLNILAKRNGTSLEIWAQPEANLSAANTFILLSNVFYQMVSADLIYNSSAYFAYAVYTDSMGGNEERSDYSIVLLPNESVYLGFASQSGSMTGPIMCGWVELELDGAGMLTVVRSACDRDGDPIYMDGIPSRRQRFCCSLAGRYLD